MRIKLPIIERIKIYSFVMRLTKTGLSRKEIIYYVCQDFRISRSTVESWLNKKSHPLGLHNKPIRCKGLFYVLGALLGDGCYYYWERNKVFFVNLVGDKRFTEKYACKLSTCLGKPIKAYKRGTRNFWFVNKANPWLYFLFKRVRENPQLIEELIRKGDAKGNALEFIEGFFDAEGCVKVIKEPCRKTPKICLDITNTNYELLEPIRILLKEFLAIEARYSIQKPGPALDGFNRKITYHLRVYKKAFVEVFFSHIQTTKSSPEKDKYVKKWLETTHLVNAPS